MVEEERIPSWIDGDVKKWCPFSKVINSESGKSPTHFGFTPRWGRLLLPLPLCMCSDDHGCGGYFWRRGPIVPVRECCSGR